MSKSILVVLEDGIKSKKVDEILTVLKMINGVNDAKIAIDNEDYNYVTAQTITRNEIVGKFEALLREIK